MLLFFLLSFSSSVFAYDQTEGICYSQCLAYKFVWRGDYCYDQMVSSCSISAGDAAIKTVSILKNVVSSVITGKLTEIVDISTLFKAWLICKLGQY